MPRMAAPSASAAIASLPAPAMSAGSSRRSRLATMDGRCVRRAMCGSDPSAPAAAAAGACGGSQRRQPPIALSCATRAGGSRSRCAAGAATKGCATASGEAHRSVFAAAWTTKSRPPLPGPTARFQRHLRRFATRCWRSTTRAAVMSGWGAPRPSRCSQGSPLASCRCPTKHSMNCDRLPRSSICATCW